ncbi:MAG: hypothetical protein ACWGIK_24890 [Achromobacter pulmonis]|uniref:hypothetical protein n=1 Tax=Achromobacter TaxID=222 RepID=UPI0014656D86|nr:hypothetical protein [Achromobacter pulmonis]MCF7767342.1 hypothetical protein [Achromobacter pulmonis]CAB3632118.1 hypothetical protein LMG26696_00941 [Achromobacter pulmonis]
MRILIAIILFISLAGCGATLKPVKPDATTGLFSTTVGIAPSDIEVAERFDPAYRRMLFINVKSNWGYLETIDYFQTSIEHLGTFEQVLTRKDIDQKIIAWHLQDKVSDVSNLLGLNLLSKQIGNFLILDVGNWWKGGYHYEGSLQAMDASTGKTVFKTTLQAFNWDGLDASLFRPLLNAFVLWTKNELPGPQPGSK